MTSKCFMCGTSKNLLSFEEHLLNKIPEIDVCFECTYVILNDVKENKKANEDGWKRLQELSDVNPETGMC